jgi:CRISPR system Cascade subunit CasA
MSATNNFNLVDDAWVPSETGGMYSLADVFSGRAVDGLGGNAMEKVAILKLLLAVAQAAHTPEDFSDWEELGPEGLGRAASAYLRKWHDAFWLRGDKPFMQMPAIDAAGTRGMGTFLLHVAGGNATILQDLQKEQPIGDAERARLILILGGYACGGKAVDNAVVLSPGYGGKRNDKGKPSSGKSGPWLGFLGYLHHFLYSRDILRLVWLNLLTVEDLVASPLEGRLGRAPWEAMPKGEDCPEARDLRASLMGRLTPLSRFVLFEDDGAHYSEGLAYPSHKDGWFDTSIAYSDSGKKPVVAWADPDRLPWRDFPALLAFLANEKSVSSYGLQCCLERAREIARLENENGSPAAERQDGETGPRLGVWIGGIRVSSNAGEQYVSGRDDYVDSLYFLPADKLDSAWEAKLKEALEQLTRMEKTLFACVSSYMKEMQRDPKSIRDVADLAKSRFWERCNHEAQRLLDSCDDEEAMKPLRDQYWGFVQEAYDSVCPNETARQLAAWGKCLPKFAKKKTAKGGGNESR